MTTHSRSVAALAALVVCFSPSAVFAGGDQNAYNNPTGDPPADTYQTPYANIGEGRMLVSCAEAETLLTTNLPDGSVEHTCVPAE
jgi:hypothetical protein